MKKTLLGVSLLACLGACGSGSNGIVGDIAGQITDALNQTASKDWKQDPDALAALWQTMRISVGNAALQSVLRPASKQYVGYGGACERGGSFTIEQDANVQLPHYMLTNCVTSLVPGLSISGGIESNGAIRSDIPLNFGGSILNAAGAIRATEGVLTGGSTGMTNLGSAVKNGRFTADRQALSVDEFYFDANFSQDRPGAFTNGGMNGQFSIGDTHYLAITKTRMDWSATDGPVAGRIDIVVTKGGTSVRQNYEFTGAGAIVSYHPVSKAAVTMQWNGTEMKAARARF